MYSLKHSYGCGLFAKYFMQDESQTLPQQLYLNQKNLQLCYRCGIIFIATNHSSQKWL